MNKVGTCCPLDQMDALCAAEVLEKISHIYFGCHIYLGRQTKQAHHPVWLLALHLLLLKYWRREHTDKLSPPICPPPTRPLHHRDHELVVAMIGAVASCKWKSPKLCAMRPQLFWFRARPITLSFFDLSLDQIVCLQSQCAFFIKHSYTQ